MARFEDNVILQAYWQEDPTVGGELTHRTSVSTTSLNTGGTTTDIDLNIPVGANIRAVSSKIVDAIAGVSATGVTVNLAFTGGNTADIGNFVAAGDGNVVANSKLKKILPGGVSGAVSGTPADMRVTISGGADNTPTAGSIKIVVHYTELADLD